MIHSCKNNLASLNQKEIKKEGYAKLIFGNAFFALAYYIYINPVRVFQFVEGKGSEI